MNIEISDQATKRIQAAIGTTDPKLVGQIIERIAQDEQLLLSYCFADPSDADLKAIREGIDDAQAGNTQPLGEFDAEFRSRHGFAPKEQA